MVSDVGQRWLAVVGRRWICSGLVRRWLAVVGGGLAVVWPEGGFRSGLAEGGWQWLAEGGFAVGWSEGGWQWFGQKVVLQWFGQKMVLQWFGQKMVLQWFGQKLRRWQGSVESEHETS
jgi:hypothetical protein